MLDKPWCEPDSLPWRAVFAQQFGHPSLAEQQAKDSYRGWKHQPEPNNHAISRHINNSRDKKLQFCMIQDKYNI